MLLKLAAALLLFAVPVHAQQRYAPESPKAPPRIAGHSGEPRPQGATTTIRFGVNGHDGRATYPLSGIEARMQWMQQNRLVNWRTDVGTTSTDILDKLVPLAKKYGVTVRPMLYPGTQAATYALVKRYAADIKVWEIGNEQDAPKAGAQDRINAMMQSVRGVEQAEAELRAGLKTSINIMSCNNEAGSGSHCEGDPNGAVWFLDMAKASGWNFSYVTFHYYPRAHDVGHWMDKYLGQMRHAATKFGVPIFFNETNCGEIYDGNTDGGGTCPTSLQQVLDEVTGKYADVVQEVAFGFRHRLIDPGTSGEMNDPLNFANPEQVSDDIRVSRAAFDKQGPMIYCREMTEAEVVQHRDRVSEIQQVMGANRPDVSGPACNQDIHAVRRKTRTELTIMAEAPPG